MPYELQFSISYLFCFETFSGSRQFFRHKAIFPWLSYYFLRLNYKWFTILFFFFREDSQLFDIRRLWIALIEMNDLSLSFSLFLLTLPVKFHQFMRIINEAYGLVVWGLMWTEDIISFFVIFKLKIKILDYLICSLHLFMIYSDLLV